ncbi:MAG: tetraacyldisaccharide 4'-kinase [Pseudomonadota bacterium]
MKAPRHWSNPPEAPGLRAALLTPAGWAYGLAGRLRRAASRPMRARVPVICVGNLTAGGAGKTPTTLALCDRLAALGLEAHVLSRGYGARLKGPLRVDPSEHDAEAVGDEPLLMAQRRPVWIGADRRETAAEAVLSGAQILVMDDGYQNPHLHQDLPLVVIDAQAGFGNERLIPAGPLREPLERGFARAGAAIMIGRPKPGERWPWTPPGLPLLHARLAADTGGRSLKGAKIIAFAGIGRPEKFFDTLRDLGADLVETTAFPDHHRYSAAMLQRLEARAQARGATLATTEKDAVRFPKWFRGRALVVRVSLGFAEPAAIDAVLRPLIDPSRAADARVG